ncbi:MAG: DEAD/DEAH box helicase [Chitinispirillales bacterium]|jgi:ATP-dependent RNA helicase RhlB|nr:DEAD/DEAH box helicase [Chitinispirillales bacterium]
MKFSEFNLNPDIVQALDSAGYTDCMPVQAQTLEHTLLGKDVFVQSQTGTGKTAAFLVSTFALLRSGALKHSKALIIAPTRELAVQIENEANLLGYNLGFGICSFYGGVGYAHQEQCLADGVDIMIGTPGRILDFKKSRKIDFSKIGIFVIDEADRLFDMGFLPDIIEMLRSLPPCCERKTMLFSATLSREVRKIAREYMDHPAEIEIAPQQVTVDAITQELYHVSSNEKMNLLLGILKKENPSSVLIFTNMKGEARIVAEKLRLNGFPCEHISGDLPQGKRSRIVERVKSGKLRYLVATDVAARGIHIDDLALVVNYDVPEYCENYVHRIGRTARAGKSGKAITLACEEYVYALDAIEQYIGKKIPTGFANSELYAEDCTAGMVFRRTERMAGGRGQRGRSSSRGGSGRGGSRGSPKSSSYESRRSEHKKTGYQKTDQTSSGFKRGQGNNTGSKESTEKHSRPEPRGQRAQQSSTIFQKGGVNHVKHQAAASQSAPEKVGWFGKIRAKLFNHNG